MGKGNVLYNPLAGNGKTREVAEMLEVILDENLEYYDMTRITNYKAFFGSLREEDELIIVGGDGTLNRFVNSTVGIDLPKKILYFPTGTGNDFASDLGKRTYHSPFPISEYLSDLPSVEVNGQTFRFLNGIGFGIDGYCCKVGDERKKIPGKKVNYAFIAIEGLLFHFRSRNAKVTVDGKCYEYQKVWIAPTMHGRCYGGGMIPTPGQDRTSGNLSLMLVHGAGRIRTLCVFPGIFKGKHVKHKKMVAVHTGREITVEFDRPTPLQIDGETIRDVTGYKARAGTGCGKTAKENA